MNDEIQIISTDDGITLLGDPRALDLFLEQEHLESRPLPTTALRRTASAGSAAAEVGALVAENSGRWVKLTKESAELVHRYGLRNSAATKNATGVLKGNKGQIKGFVEFAKTPAAALTSPAALAGIGGIAAQMAMQLAMDEITEYLAVIDAKVDDVLRAQKDAAVAELLGVGLVLDEAMAVRDAVGRVSDVTWSKVDQAPLVIASAQSYAIRRLDALAEKLEKESKVGDLAKLMRQVDEDVREWLGVLARTFQLADAVAILELDRVLDSDAASVDAHREGLATARARRVELIESTTRALLARIRSAAALANDKVLLNPLKAPAVVSRSNRASGAVVGLQETLGLATEATELESRAWKSAATDARDRLALTSSEKVDAARDLGERSVSSAKSAAADAAGRLKALRTRRG